VSGRALVITAALCAACSGGSDPQGTQIQFRAFNQTSDTLIVWWWWQGVQSADIPDDPVVVPPGVGVSRCVTFTPVAWAQIDAAQGSHGRNSSAGDWRDNLITIDPARTSYWSVAASTNGGQPSVVEETNSIC